MMQEKELQILSLSFQFLEYNKVAEGYGGKGFLLDRTNEDQLDDIITEAQRECKQGNSVLVNCLIGKTSFREGSISV